MPSLGTRLVLFPLPTLTGPGIFAVLFPFMRKSSVALGTGGAVIALVLCLAQEWRWLVYAVGVFLFVLVKPLIDSQRRRDIALAGR